MFFKEGKNCWRTAQAGRIAFLVDGEAYFQAFADACEAARKAIYIIGWDLDSRIRLRRTPDSSQESLGSFVDRLAKGKPDLHIYLLEWDFAMFYSLERENWPLFSFGWRTHERVHFDLDNDHPVGASHHQKIVVVDDALAFVGGFDLANSRWDTSAHVPKHPGRNDDGKTYGPFHDVQMLVDGEVARLLGELARQRWERATGEQLSEVKDGERDPWPKEQNPSLEKVRVAILRTVPEYESQPEVREIERFYQDAIESATTSIYIENQYLTSHLIGQALEKSLRAETGPEILLVLPKKCSGWLEEETMGALRQRLLQRLFGADSQNRLKVCYPDREELNEEIINVHSKVMIVDQDLLTIGSANLSNRSMGFDTECNLAIAAEGSEAVARAIETFRNQLIAEHTGVDPKSVGDTMAQKRSLIKLVTELEKNERFLEDLRPETEKKLTVTLTADDIVDPERPIAVDRLLEEFGIGSAPDRSESSLKRKAWRFLGVLAVAILLALLWRWSPLKEWLDLDALLAAADALRNSSLTIPIVLAIYLFGSCLMFPVTLMILATALSFGPFMGFALAFAGSLLGGLTSYLLGRWLGREVVQRLAGEKLNRLSRKLARRGWLAIAVVRIIPVAPFTIVNLVAGSTHISTRSFLVGTAVGMAPGIMAIMIFEGGLEQALRDPGWGSVSLALLAACCAIAVMLFGKRWLLKQEENRED